MSLTMPSDLTLRLDQRRGACALIAIKERSRCKTRLSAALAPAARLHLVRSMLAAVLSAAGGARTVRQIIVVSPERDTVPAEVAVLADSGEGLNSALMHAHRVLRKFGCEEVVILPADLPNDHRGRDRRFGARRPPRRLCDRARRGRSGYECAVPGIADVLFAFNLALDSRRLHLQEAERTGLNSEVVRLARPGI